MKSRILSTLIEHVERDGDKVAFIGRNATSGASYTLTYSQLLEQVQETARHFQQHAARCIAIYAENCLTWLVADLAAMYAEIPCIPIPKFFSDSQIDHILSQTQADLLIYDTCLDGFEPVGELGELSIGRREAQITAQTPAILPGTVKITFTSGSTGQPKGVCLSQSNLDKVTDSLAQMMRTQPGLDQHLVMLPLSTLLENITGAYVPLYLGVTSVVLDGASVGLMGSSQFDAVLWMKILLEYRPNTLVLTPALLHALIALTQQNPDVAASLGFVAVGGCPCLWGNFTDSPSARYSCLRRLWDF
ncbi:AMP-binding protein [Vibrio sp. PP-XX7]